MINAALYDRSRQPLFMQAAGQLRLKITRGEWAPGTQLPVIDDLQTVLGLSRATVREALEVLEREGLIHRQRGRGTFVRDNLPFRRPHRLPTDWPSFLKSLTSIEATVVGSMNRKLEFDVKDVLLGRVEAPFVSFQRVHKRDGSPYCLIDIDLRESIFDADRTDFLAVPVVLVLARKHPTLLGTVRQNVSFSTADEVAALALDIALGAPVVEILRTIVDSQNSVVLHTYSRYPGEYVQIAFEFSPREISETMVEFP